MSIKWLEDAPKVRRGIAWGQPWEREKLWPEEALHFNRLGNAPIQTKVMAYWPDGSVKWTGHSAVFDSKSKLDQDISAVEEEAAVPIAVEKYNGIYVDNGIIQSFFPKHGEGKNVVDWMKMNGKQKINHLRLFAQVGEEQLWSSVERVELEENGLVKAVIKVTGTIQYQENMLQKFIVRFRFYKDVEQVEIIHTLILGAAESLDGLGLCFETPLEGEDWNRHVHISGEDGVYTEPAQLLLSRRHAIQNEFYAKQVKGEIVDLEEEEPLLQHAKENAVWNHFALTQTSHNDYELTKQTDRHYTAIRIGCGKRSKGVMYAGGRNGGVACAIEKFWEKAPRKIEMSGLSERSTCCTAWLWSPEGGSMDFRHYSERDHMLSAYEGMEEIRSTPVGIANTNTLLLRLFDRPAKQEEIAAFAEEAVKGAQVVMEPKDYYQTKVFGKWSLPDYSSPIKKFLEEQLLYLRNFYLREIEQRDWYGFWDYGDVMHTYDPYRHVWRYDMGGYAWQNTELVPNMWLWQDFLRTGDADVFYLAEAMTRHTSEVDQYHLGEYEGLGSRHNVLHWGCQCKEARISMAGLHRYYYFLTADERIGEIMEAVKDNEEKIFDELAPLREFYPLQIEEKYPIRVGPDWASLTSNWFTEWERTGNEEYRDRILKGIESISGSKNRLLSGPTYLFDKQTKELHYFGTGNVGGYHMIISFGAPQVWLELTDSLEKEEWKELLAEFGRFYALPDEEKRQLSEGKLYDQHFSWPVFATGLMGYAADYKQDEGLARHAWEVLLNEEISGVPLPMQETLQSVNIWKKVEEMPWISTNIASQWCLNIILCLEFIAEYLPTTIKNKNVEEIK